ncbi:unnamed protein product [Enterobius vermicularis]|uniref:Enoyl-CoA hydratase n=1 Tax=Enterobius vermicularis TaxID=51028 RepID=A0A0N4VMX2_ENTVE|nr:unnamed protein product [Enterobius vermicularis]
MPLKEVPSFVSRLRQFVSDLANLHVPTIAALDGIALGGGLEVALGCDIRVASTSARLGLPEVKLAIFPGAGGTQRLTRIIGIARAKELIFTGRILSATDAERIGLVNCVANEEITSAYQVSLDMASLILKGGPCAIKLAKSVINEGAEMTLPESLEVERKGYAEVLKTEDRNEGLKAFSEKRPPVYCGR